MSESAKFASLDDFEQHAKRFLPYSLFYFFSFGCENEKVLKRIRKAYTKLYLMPRIMRDVSTIDLERTALGSKVRIPMGISPTANHGGAHQEGELATARGAGAVGVVYTQSFWSTYSVKEVNTENPATLHWMQIDIINQTHIWRKVTKNAENSGVKALVITLDNPYGNAINRPEIIAGDNFKYMKVTGNASFEELGYQTLGDGEKDNVRHIQNITFTGKRSWAQLTELVNSTHLPVVAKGILNAEDAAKAVQAGVSAILVSAHGNRLTDSLPPPLYCLPHIARAVKNINKDVQIYIDGGVRTGYDVIKALCLGADLVFVGRPVLWALASGGYEGVINMFNVIEKEIRGGVSNLDQLNRSYIVTEQSLTSSL